ncbi:metal ABC transporter ATP-binding protein [Nitratiruptor sp. YY09-18]|uniref:metal ABC transporter ATP-binding protein n=1 Tax=Nitratiruptor sp. YY09-18 TaxID=2724901 RepID=UPI001F3C2B7B|nr:ABC transporter ATP-binding protein [Nitratiruptor sp. YY09-18]
MRSLAIDIRNLWFRYDKEYVLEDITAQIFDKEYIAIIGPNGGGKTTFLRLLAGLLQPTKGSITIYGKSPQEAQKFIGYLPQNVNFNLDMPLQAKDIILQGRLNPKKFRFNQKDYKKLEEIAAKLAIEEILERKISDLSGGQRQRVLLARALVTDPKILILDEPTASVDLQAQRQIYHILQELSITRLVVSHDINIILKGVDRVFYINRKLFIHDKPNIHIHSADEHFCEMDLFEELQKGCNV